MDDPVQEIVEALRSNPTLLHALLFEPDAVASHLKSREAKALVYGIDPRAFIQSLRRSLSYRECGATCQNSCGNSCGGTCNGSCGGSCGATCTYSVRRVEE
jgi:hypothetical protein